jgi:hypothetical protein
MSQSNHLMRLPVCSITLSHVVGWILARSLFCTPKVGTRTSLECREYLYGLLNFHVYEVEVLGRRGLEGGGFSHRPVQYVGTRLRTVMIRYLHNVLPSIVPQ